jgi:uncharacterized protein
MTIAIVDTGVVLALAIADDPRHDDVARALGSHVGGLILPDPVLFESAQLVGRRFGPTSEAQLIRRLVATDWRRMPVTDEDLDRAAALLESYADANIGFADGTIVAMAERLGATRLFTLDRRDFGIMRPRHVDAFELLP